MALTIIWRKRAILVIRQWYAITDAYRDERARNSKIFGSDNCYKPRLCGGGCVNDVLQIEARRFLYMINLMVCNHRRVLDERARNSPFPSSSLSLRQTSLSEKQLLWKCVPPTTIFSCKSNSFSYEKFCTKTRFETEANQNSENGLLENLRRR